MIDPPSTPAILGLRARKKAMTRATIVDMAKTLFDQRGYDGVTTAEIADASNVSVKTLFSYFESKEDLLFHGENEFRDLILGLVRQRPDDMSPFDAIARYIRVVASPEQRHAFEVIQNLKLSLGENRNLRARLALMWDRFELSLSTLLSAEANKADDPISRLIAAQIMSLFRMLASDELNAYLTSLPARDRKKGFQRWADDTLALVGGGIENFGRRE